MAAVGGATRTAAFTAAFTALAAVAPISWGTTYLVTTEFLPPDHRQVHTSTRDLSSSSGPHGVRAPTRSSGLLSWR